MFINSKIYIDDISSICREKLPWEKLSGKTVLISGASGMIGCSLIDALMKRNDEYNDDISIIALGRDANKAKLRFSDYLERKDFRFISHDINDPIPDAGKADYIIHAASNTHPAQYSGDPIGTISANIFGTSNLLDYAVACKSENFVFLSSVEIYGENDTEIDRFMEEDLGYIDCNSLRAGYPESKRVGEAMCNAYKAEYDLDFVIPRLCRIYGPTVLSTDTKASSQCIKKGLSGEDIILKSKGDQLYSYAYITDCITAILYIMLLGENGNAYNLADSDSDVTLKWLAETIADFAGTKVIFDLPDASEAAGFSKATKALLNNDKLKKLGWSAKETMKSGIEKTLTILKET